MKVIVLSALLGLSLAGFRTDVQKVGDFISKNPQVIEDGLKVVGDLTNSGNTEELFDFSGALHDAGDVAGIVGTGLKIAEVVGDAAFVNVGGLIQDGIKTVGDATQKNKNVGQLVQDGLKVIGDLTANNANTEELFDFSDALHDAGDVAGIVGTGLKVAEVVGDAAFVNVGGLIQDGIKTVGDATQKNKNVGQLVQDGLKVIGDLTANNGNTEELFDFSDALHDAGDVAGIVGTGLKVAEVVGDAAFVNVGGLIQDGIKTVGDATQKKKNVGELIQDGLKVVGDLTAKNGNTEELFDFSDALHDAGAAAGVINAGITVAGLFA